MPAPLNKPLKNRRRFLKESSLLFMSSLLGAEIVYGAKLPSGLLPLGIEEFNGRRNPRQTSRIDHPQ